MRKIRLGLVFLALITGAPASAQHPLIGDVRAENNKDIIDCVRANGGIRIVQGGQIRWYFPNEALNARYMDCVGRKAALAPATPAKTPPKPTAPIIGAGRTGSHL
jgi:hypothetical protein